MPRDAFIKNESSSSWRMSPLAQLKFFYGSLRYRFVAAILRVVDGLVNLLLFQFDRTITTATI